MIQLQHIRKSFGHEVVIHDLSFEIKEGETLVVLGLSGSGKTTMLKLINRLLEPDSGSISFDGKKIKDWDILELRRKMGYVIQQGGLFPHYNIYENVAVVPRLLGWREEKIRERVELVLNKLHLNPDEFSEKYPSELSGGQQQRIGLARALAGDPPVLLMDEPFGALDPITRRSIRKEFRELEELKSKTIILVTHDVQEAFELGDRIALLQHGQLAQIDTPARFLREPKTDFIKEFIRGEMLGLGLKEEGLYEDLNQALSAGNIDFSDFKKLLESGHE